MAAFARRTRVRARRRTRQYGASLRSKRHSRHPGRVQRGENSQIRVRSRDPGEKCGLKVFPNKKLVLCEGRNAPLYNAIELPDFLFVTARDKNAVTIQARASRDFFGLMDRDFLGTEEIEEIRRRHPNLFVLGYYSIENYLYHPTNVAAISPNGFDETGYREAVRRNMKAARDRLLVNLDRSRRSYEIIKEFSKDLKDKAIEEITRATGSSDFETFYPFLDMKTNRPGGHLAGFNLQPRDLASTGWMRESIGKVVGAG